MPESAAAGEKRAAVAAGLACAVIWGFVPLVFQAIAREGAGSWETLCERIIWGGLAAAIFVGFARQWGQVARVLREPRTLALLALSSCLIGVNWISYIWAVNSHRVLDASLGYYITPLVSMAAGAFMFRERLSRLGLVAIALAAAGVIVQAVAIGHLPLISLVLALSFGSYGIVRKRVAADAQTGLLIECLILLAPALAYVVWLERSGAGHLFSSPQSAAWLLASGPITAAPLALFAWAARRMPLSAMGFLQFLSPTITFGVGLAQGEAFTHARAISFALIWLGATLFVLGALRAARTARLARGQVVAPLPNLDQTSLEETP